MKIVINKTFLLQIIQSINFKNTAMKTLIIFDSFFGNTEKIANAVSKHFKQEETSIIRIADFKPEHLKGVSTVIIGSPTRKFSPTELITKFINEHGSKLAGLNCAAYDTRIDLDTIKSGLAKFFVSKGGYAANTMAKKLTKLNANLLLPGEGFLVTGEQGPLKEGEIERAEEWGKKICNV